MPAAQITGTQSLILFEPTAENELSGHLAHSLFASPEMNVPAGHGSHIVLFKLRTVAGPHAMHCEILVAPNWDVNPGGHGLH